MSASAAVGARVRARELVTIMELSENDSDSLILGLVLGSRLFVKPDRLPTFSP